MSIGELIKTIKELRELKRMREELEAEICTMEDALKAHMTDIGVNTVETSAYKVTWKPVTSTRIDTAALKSALPDIAQRFTKTTTTRRLIVA